MFMEKQLPQYCPQQSKHIKINLYFWTCMASEKSRNYQIFDFQNGHVADVWRDMAFEKPQQFVFYSGCTQTGHWNLSENTTHINSLIVNGSTAGFTFVRFFNTFPIMTALWSEKTSYIVFKSVSFLLAVSSLCFQLLQTETSKTWENERGPLRSTLNTGYITALDMRGSMYLISSPLRSTSFEHGLYHSFGHVWLSGYFTALDTREVYVPEAA